MSASPFTREDWTTDFGESRHEVELTGPESTLVHSCTQFLMLKTFTFFLKTFTFQLDIFEILDRSALVCYNGGRKMDRWSDTQHNRFSR